MGRHKNGLARGGQVAQQITQFDARAGIETGRGFVQQQHLRVVDERAGQSQPLLPPPAEHPRGAVRELRASMPGSAGTPKSYSLMGFTLEATA